MRHYIPVVVHGHVDERLDLFASTTQNGLLYVMVELLLHAFVSWSSVNG